MYATSVHHTSRKTCQTALRNGDVYQLILCAFRSQIAIQICTRCMSSQMYALSIVHSAILIRNHWTQSRLYFSSLQAISGFQERPMWNCTHSHARMMRDWKPCRLCFATIHSSHTGGCLATNWEQYKKKLPTFASSNWNQCECTSVFGRFNYKLYYFESERWSTITSHIQHVIHACLNFKGLENFHCKPIVIDAHRVATVVATTTAAEAAAAQRE